MFEMLSPASCGALMTASILFFIFMGYVLPSILVSMNQPRPLRILGGYHAARLYKILKGTHWKQAAALVSVYAKNMFQ